MSRHPLNGLLAFLILCTMEARSEPSPQGKSEPESGHLVPVDPYATELHRSYVTACHELLRVGEFETAELFVAQKYGTVVMVRRPSFQPEECLILREKSGEQKYELIHAKAGRNIFNSMSNGGRKRISEISVKKAGRPIEQVRAVRIYNLWARMLRRVRYSEDGPRAGCPDDGETFEFRYKWKGMYGEICTPSRGSPRMLADLGNSLILFCTAPDDQSKKALDLVDKKCEELEGLLDAEDTARNE